MAERQEYEAMSLSTLENEPNFGLETLLETVNQRLIEFSSSDRATVVLETAFGVEDSTTDIETLQEALQSGAFFNEINVEVIPSAALEGALGAYAIAHNQIYLSEELLVSSPEKAGAVLLEEVGHAIDAHLNATDTSGDEGAIFSALVQGESLSEEALIKLRQEDDTAILEIEGKTVLVEQAESIIVSEDFESYSTGNSYLDNSEWTKRLPSDTCFPRIQEEGGNKFIESSSCSPAQGIRTPFEFLEEYSNSTINLEFSGQITNESGNNSSAGIYFIGSYFGLRHQPRANQYYPQLDHQLIIRRAGENQVFGGPELTPGVWYDILTTIDWSYSNEDGSGLATLKYKEQNSDEWITDPNLSDIELNVEDVSAIDTLEVRLDGIGNRFGRVDDIEIYVNNEAPNVTELVAVETTFDEGLDGWTEEAIDQPPGNSFEPTNGNPGGYLLHGDTGPGGSSLIAPDKFLGDWSSFSSVSYDHKVFSTGDFDSVSNQRIIIEDLGEDSEVQNAAQWTGPIVDEVSDWQTFSVPIAEENWEVTDGNWTDLIQNVDRFKITTEHFRSTTSLGEQEGFDNIRLFSQTLLTVTNTNDSGDGSFRSAIEQANQIEGENTIVFDSSLSGETINLTSGQLEITDDLVIEGLGADQLTIDAGGNSRVFLLNDDDGENLADITIDGLTITGGVQSVNDTGNFPVGGGILNRENLLLTNSTVTGNSATGGSGGGIIAYGVATLINTTVSNNTAPFAGGGISTNNVTLINSTVSGNTGGQGSGITNYASPGGTANVTLINSTVSNNSGGSSGIKSFGGSNTLTLINSIVANNSGSEIDERGTLITDGVNLIGDNSLTGENIINGDPQLSPLQDNGGTTLTHIPLEGSPAIDAGDNSQIPPDTFDLDSDGDTDEPIPFDGRGNGFDRVSNGTVDIGAVEVQSDGGNGNTNPVANPDSFTTDEDTPTTGNVLANDTDDDSDDLTISAVNGDADSVGIEIELASGALLTLNNDGNVDYNPNGQFEDLNEGETATDNFTYTVNDGNGGTDTATATVTIDGVDELPAGELAVDIIIPDELFPFDIAQVEVTYTNVGDADLPAPLLNLSVEGGLLQALGEVKFDQEDEQFLALDEQGSPIVLAPGESSSFSLPFIVTANSGGQIDFEVTSVADDEPIDWAVLQDEAQPTFISDEVWTQIYQNYTASVGDTFGEWRSLLTDNAEHFNEIGEPTKDVNSLLAFEFQQASDFQALAQRLEVGSLGQGWSFVGDTRAIEEENGDVTIDYGGSGRLFELQPNGTYRSQPGDYGTLTQVGSAYRLREKDGTVTEFRDDGRFSSVEDPNGRGLTAIYTGDLLTRLESCCGDFTDYTYNAFDRIETATDQSGFTVTYGYDATGEFLTSFTNPVGTTSYNYNSDGLLESITDPEGVVLQYEYDDQGRIIEESLTNDAEVLTYSYDSAGTVTITDADNQDTELLLNDRGQISKIEDPLGRVSRFQYDEVGNLTEVDAPENLSLTLEYDSLGNLTRQLDGLNQEIEFTYEPNFNFIETVTDDRDNTLTYDYDNQGNLLSITYADSSAETFTPDAQGNIEQYVNRRGTPISYDYNPQGQVTRVDYNDGSFLEYDYDLAGNLTLAAEEDNNGARSQTSLDYDNANRLTKITYPTGRFLEYDYDSAGRRTRMSDQDGNEVNYTYDSAGRLETLTDENANPIVSYSYDAVGRLEREDNGNGTYTTYDYDDAGQLTSIINYAPDDSINSSFDYTYNDLGLRTGVTTLDGEWTYGYDATGQLTSAVFNSTNPEIANQDISYIYDGAGNRIQTIINGDTTDYATNNLNQYETVGATVYNYDDDGNLTSKVEGGETWTYGYDDQNRLVNVVEPDGTVTEYEYDPLGNRVATIYDGVRTEYLVDPFGFGDVVGEYDGNGGLVAEYVHGLGLVNRTDASDTASYYDFNAIGSTVGLTGTSGDVLNSYNYLPFGDRLSETEAVANSFEFVGQFGVMEESNGLDFMRARFYDGETGRFTSTDPIGLNGGDVNLYRYAGNSPSNAIDPSGEAAIILPAIGVAVVSAGVGAGVGLYERSLRTGDCDALGSKLLDAGEILVAALGITQIKGGALVVITGTGSLITAQTLTLVGATVGPFSLGRGLAKFQPFCDPSENPEPTPQPPETPPIPPIKPLPPLDEDGTPIGNEDGGESTGDPHLTTFDRLDYDFQAVGEFTFVQSLNNDLEIQVRQAPVPDRPVSVNSAVAMLIDGEKVGIYADEAIPLFVGDNPVEIASGELVQIGDGFVFRENDIYNLVSPEGDRLVVNLRTWGAVGQFLNLEFIISEDREEGSVVGLLGNNDGDRSNDIALRDGTAITQRPIPFDALYRDFASRENGWRITQEESLFVYADGEDTDTFTDLNFPEVEINVDDLDPVDRATAEEIVRNAGIPEDDPRFNNAVLDLALTGDEVFVEAAQESTPAEETLEVNERPIANADEGEGFTTNEDTPLTTPNVLTNDSDPENDPFSIIAVNTDSTLGTVTDNGDGTFNYDPSGQFDNIAEGSTATDTFTYTISDGGNGGINTATVTILIEGVNDAPVAVNDSFTTDQDTILDIDTANGVLANDSDADDGDSFAIAAVEGNADNVGSEITLPSGALLTLNADGSYQYNPNGQFISLAIGETATDNFTYLMNDDNGESDTATVTITIEGLNDTPSAIADNFTTDEDTGFTTGNVLSNDSDPDGDTLFVSAIDDSETIGLVTDNGDGTFDYDPNGQFESLNEGETATDSFSYTVTDGNENSTATVTIEIQGVNDTPSAIADTFTTDEDTSFTTGNVLNNDTDIDGDTLTVSAIDDSETIGLVTDNGDGTFNYDPNGQFASLNQGETATDSFSYTITDGNGGTDTSTVTITINGITDPIETTTLSIAPLDAVKEEGDSGTTPFTFEVTRSGGLSNETTVSFVVENPALPDVIDGQIDTSADDFGGGVFPNGTLTFPAGETSQTLTIEVAGDTIPEIEDEGLENRDIFLVTLNNSSGDTEIEEATATGEILNDDEEAIATVTVEDVSQSESNTTFEFEINVTPAVTTTLNFSVTATETNPTTPDDFVGGVNPSGLVDIVDGQGSIGFEMENDAEIEDNETFQLVITPEDSDEILATAIATIENDDEPDAPTSLVFGTLENDSLEAGIDFDGDGNPVFTGAGSDLVDASVGEGSNRLYSGSDDDELFAGTRDRVFGGTGNDLLDASVGNGENRLYGGAGDDDFFLGANDRLIGNEGSDRFFTGTGGDNVITGGTGADQFWIAMPTARSATYAEIPNAVNTITDFTLGEDVIGFGGFPELTFADLTLTQEDSSTVISLGADTELVEEDTAIALLLGVEANTLTEDDFTFAAVTPF